MTRLSKPNIVWEIDFFYFPRRNNKYGVKQQVYLSLVDNFSKYCILVTNVKNKQKTNDIIGIVNDHIKQCNITPKIIHSDYGIQFTARNWYNYNQELFNLYGTTLSVAGKSVHSTHTTNFVIKVLKNNLKKIELSDENLDKILLSEVASYNKNYIIKSFNKTPYELYYNLNYSQIKPVMSPNFVIPFNDKQEYIEKVTKHIINNNLSEFENNLPIENISKQLNVIENNYVKKNFHLYIKPRTVVTKPTRDIITPQEFNFIINSEELYSLKNNTVVYKLRKRTYFQVKIIMILLYLTGCRISEITCLSFFDINNALKKASIKIWSGKDGQERLIPLKNRVMLKKLKFYFEELKEFCINKEIFYSNDTFICFKVVKLSGVLTAVNLSIKNTMKEYINCVLKFYTNSSQFANKNWSTHSFRHTLITKLIDNAGLVAASQFIGHKHLNTTQFYYNKQKSYQKINKLADLI